MEDQIIENGGSSSSAGRQEYAPPILKKLKAAPQKVKDDTVNFLPIASKNIPDNGLQSALEAICNFNNFQKLLKLQ